MLSLSGSLKNKEQQQQQSASANDASSAPVSSPESGMAINSLDEDDLAELLELKSTRGKTLSCLSNLAKNGPRVV
jgi:hypothetical protein